VGAGTSSSHSRVNCISQQYSVSVLGVKGPNGSLGLYSFVSQVFVLAVTFLISKVSSYWFNCMCRCVATEEETFVYLEVSRGFPSSRNTAIDVPCTYK
jgi:hypothetical protein